MASAARATRPTFAPNPRRRALLAKIHVALKELGLTDDDYRAVLFRVTGKASATACSDSKLEEVVKELQAKGFKPKPKAHAADHPVARKARALWISLHHLNVISNPAEEALEAFARAQLRVEKLQWANQSQGYKLIEALKAMAERAGWEQTIDPVAKVGATLILQKRLVDAILVKLKKAGLAAEAWTLEQAAWSLCGMASPQERGWMKWELGELEAIARSFGNILRSGGDRA